MVVEHRALLGIALDQRPLQTLAFGHIMDEGIQQRPPVPGHGAQMHLDIAHLAVREPMTELDLLALVGGGEREIAPDFLGRCFVDVLQAHGAHLARVVTVETAGRRVDIDDGAIGRVDQQHRDLGAGEHRALATIDAVALVLGMQARALLVGQAQMRDQERHEQGQRDQDGDDAVLAPWRERILVGNADHDKERRGLDDAKREAAFDLADRRGLTDQAALFAVLDPIDHLRTCRLVDPGRRRRAAHDEPAVIDAAHGDQAARAQIEGFEQTANLAEFDRGDDDPQKLPVRPVDPRAGEYDAVLARLAAGHFRIDDGGAQAALRIEEIRAQPHRRQRIVAAR